MCVLTRSVGREDKALFENELDGHDIGPSQTHDSLLAGQFVGGRRGGYFKKIRYSRKLGNWETNVVRREQGLSISYARYTLRGLSATNTNRCPYQL